jgi:hypothetical protein
LTQESDLLGPRPTRRPQQRWLDAAARRAAAKAAFDALPQNEQDAIWQRVDRIVAEARWYFAKSEHYRDNPHSYARRRDFHDDADFVFMVEFLRSGVCDRERYPETGPGGRYYDTLNRHGRKIWVMGWPIFYSNGTWCTVILNKKPVEPGDL